MLRLYFDASLDKSDMPVQEYLPDALNLNPMSHFGCPRPNRSAIDRQW